MQMKYMLSCLFVLFKGFFFFSKFFLFGRSRSGRRKEAKEAKKGGKGFNERARRRKKMLNLLFARFIIFCYSSVLIRYLLCRRDGL